MIPVLKRDLFDVTPKVAAICITTNGSIRRDGAAVMGRGVARRAARLWPSVPSQLGLLLRAHGNMVHYLGVVGLCGTLRHWNFGPRLFSFPVKYEWRQKADINLITESMRQLVSTLEQTGMLNLDRATAHEIWLPKPGCGNGQLSWPEVERAIEPYMHPDIKIVDLYA